MFTNEGKRDGTAQLVRVGTPATHHRRVYEAAGAWADEGRALPPWVHLAGGLGSAPAGATISATQDLVPGKYLVADVESGAKASFVVNCEERAAKLQIPKARIDATQYEFNAARLDAGRIQCCSTTRVASPT